MAQREISDNTSAINENFSELYSMFGADSQIWGLHLRNVLDAAHAPFLYFEGYNGGWQVGIDVANSPGSRDLFIAKGMGEDNSDWYSSVLDFIYVSHNGANQPTLGIGYTPGRPDYTCSIATPDAQPENGNLLLRVGPSQTGKPLVITNSTPVDKWWIDKNFRLSPTTIIDTATPDAHLFSIMDKDAHQRYTWKFNGTALKMVNEWTGVDIVQYNNDGTLTPKAFTVATLPTASNRAGSTCYVTDGDAGLAWGATVVNSGSGATKYLVWSNGSAWTVVGK